MDKLGIDDLNYLLYNFWNISFSNEVVLLDGINGYMIPLFFALLFFGINILPVNLRKIMVAGFLPLYVLIGTVMLMLNIFDVILIDNIIYAILVYIIVLISYYFRYEFYKKQNKNKIAGVAQSGFKNEDMTIMFIDIQNYTTITEKMRKPQIVGLFLNNYIQYIERTILEYGGILDKIMGDGLMLVFRGKNKELNATKCALKLSNIKKEFVSYLEAEVIEKVKDSDVIKHMDAVTIVTVLGQEDFNIRVGFATGPVIVGAVGGKSINELTIIGDYVNLAARLEGTNKTYGTGILCDENTYEKIKDKIDFRIIDKIKVKGKNESKLIYEPMNIKGDEGIFYTENNIKNWEVMFNSYVKMDFEIAKDYALNFKKKFPNDSVIEIYVRRLEAITNDVIYLPADWDGTWMGSLLVK